MSLAPVPTLAERIEAPFGLATSAHPARLPDIAINLFWHAKFNRDPGSLWLRQRFVDRVLRHFSICRQLATSDGDHT